MRRLSGEFIDLTHYVAPDMPLNPGDAIPKFKYVSSFDKDGVNVTSFTMSTHNGTHVDAPRHFIGDGATLDSVPLTKFVGEGVVLDLSRVKIGSGITDEDLEPYSRLVKEGDIVVLYTGCSDYWGEEWIVKNFTYLEESAAEWLVRKRVNTVGIDSMSVEKFQFSRPVSHVTLLKNGIAIIESLNSMVKVFVEKRMFIVCLPLKIRGREAAPARVIAWSLLQE